MTTHTPFTIQHQFKNGSVNQQKAMEEIEDLFQVSMDKLDVLVRGVGQEMRNGLSVPETRNALNDLKMIPSFVAGKLKFRFHGKYLMQF